MRLRTLSFSASAVLGGFLAVPRFLYLKIWIFLIPKKSLGTPYFYFVICDNMRYDILIFNLNNISAFKFRWLEDHTCSKSGSTWLPVLLHRDHRFVAGCSASCVGTCSTRLFFFFCGGRFTILDMNQLQTAWLLSNRSKSRYFWDIPGFFDSLETRQSFEYLSKQSRGFK